MQIYNTLEASRILAILISPITPNLSKKILIQLDYKLSDINVSDELTWGRLQQKHHLPEVNPIIQRIERK